MYTVRCVGVNSFGSQYLYPHDLACSPCSTQHMSVYASRIFVPKVEIGKVSKNKSQMVTMIRSRIALDSDFTA